MNKTLHVLLQGRGLLTEECFNWLIEQPEAVHARTVEDINKLIKEYKLTFYLLGEKELSELVE